MAHDVCGYMNRGINLLVDLPRIATTQTIDIII